MRSAPSQRFTPSFQQKLYAKEINYLCFANGRSGGRNQSLSDRLVSARSGRSLITISNAGDHVKSSFSDSHFGAMNLNWTIREGVAADGIPFVTKRRNDIPSPEERLSYPHMVSVGWAYDGEGSKRLPTNAELERINACESALIAAAARYGAVLIGSLTCDGFHQFVVYGKDPAPLQIQLLDSLPPLAEKPCKAEMWELGTTHDPTWNFAEQI
jgi:hypothetical protein